MVETLEELIDLGELLIRWPSRRAPAPPSFPIPVPSRRWRSTSARAPTSASAAVGRDQGRAGGDRARSHPADQSARSHRAVPGRSRPLRQGDEAADRGSALRQHRAGGGARAPTHSARKMPPIIAALENFEPREAGDLRHDGRGRRGAARDHYPAARAWRAVLPLARARAARAGAACRLRSREPDIAHRDRETPASGCRRVSCRSMRPSTCSSRPGFGSQAEGWCPASRRQAEGRAGRLSGRPQGAGGAAHTQDRCRRCAPLDSTTRPR